MKQSNAKKHLVIEAEFRSFSELSEMLSKILKLAEMGVEEYKEVKDGTRYEYGMCFLHEIKYREEEINGQPCIVIQSKMNE